jgi:hypothetical protein
VSTTKQEPPTTPVDWHNVVMYFIDNIAFIYDPSALSINTSATGRLALQQAEDGVAIDSGDRQHRQGRASVAGLLRERAGRRFGQATGGTLAGAATMPRTAATAARCAPRSSSSTRFFWQRGGIGLSEAQCDAPSNLDWLLGLGRFC